ncbi:MAG: hypothetical protein QNJ62_05225 [Methyloceanibacter sp.]|nr:hypothetical protein [Methyloceanibacter sp.]
MRQALQADKGGYPTYRAGNGLGPRVSVLDILEALVLALHDGLLIREQTHHVFVLLLQLPLERLRDTAQFTDHLSQVGHAMSCHYNVTLFTEA